MTSDAVPAGGDPRRLLADARNLARRVRFAQRVTWLPLLVLAVVTFGAIPFAWISHPIESNATHGSDAPETAAFELGYFFRGLELI